MNSGIDLGNFLLLYTFYMLIFVFLNSINRIFKFFWNNIYDNQKRFQLELKITLIFIKKWFYTEFKERYYIYFGGYITNIKIMIKIRIKFFQFLF